MQLDLVPILEELGVENLREGDKEISGSCPMHPKRLGRIDRHASWSINRFTGAHNCFSCGWKGGVATLFMDLAGEVPADIFDHLQQQGLTNSLHGLSSDKEEVEPEWNMDGIVPVPAPLLEIRHLKSEAAAAYGVGWDPERRCWVLPFRLPDGEVYGAQYKQTGSFFNLPKTAPKSKSLFGIDVVKHMNLVALVESPLDAVRLFGVGIPAVSSFGVMVSDLQIRMLAKYFALVVVWLDNDTAGHIQTPKVSKSLRHYGCPALEFFFGDLPGKDPGDVTDDEELISAWRSNIKICNPASIR